LHALRLAVGPDQGVKNCEHVAAIIHHALEDVLQLRVALGFAMLFREDRAGHLNVAPQLVG